MRRADAIARLADVPVKMRKRLLPASETALTNLQTARRAHGQLLWRAAQIAEFDSVKELGAYLDVTPPQLSAWFAGTENPQTFRFEQDPILGPALLAALAESQAARGESVRTRVIVEIAPALRRLP